MEEIPKVGRETFMNIIGHFLIGAAQSLITQNPLPLLGNLFPDIVLIPNEISIKENEAFDDEKVEQYVMTLYFITHSLLFSTLCIFLNPMFGLGVLTHQIVDWYSHLGRFRTRPLYPISNWKIGKDINKKRALLISGGYDSVSILEMIDREKYDYYFFNYSQTYYKEEAKAIKEVEKYYNIKITPIRTNWQTDMKNRNFLMISRLQELGYERVCVGSRNIIPLFDKYKDSNYFILKLYGWVHRMIIETPVVFKTKKQIINEIPKELIDKLYSTEK